MWSSLRNRCEQGESLLPNIADAVGLTEYFSCDSNKSLGRQTVQKEQKQEHLSRRKTSAITTSVDGCVGGNMPLVSMEQPKKKESTDKPVEVSSYLVRSILMVPGITLNKEASRNWGSFRKTLFVWSDLERSRRLIQSYLFPDRTSIEGGDNMSVELQIIRLAFSQNKKKSAWRRSRGNNAYLENKQ